MIHDMHNDAVLWEKYYHRTLPRLSRFRCWFHLLFCKRCRLRLRRLRENDIFIAELRTALNEMSVPENPAEYLRLCELFENEGTKEE
jgi:hypothetical protein